jgi:hypothetical protein
LLLDYDNQPSKFAAELEITLPGSYEVIVYGHDPVTGNTGVDRISFLVRR